MLICQTLSLYISLFSLESTFAKMKMSHQISILYAFINLTLILICGYTFVYASTFVLQFFTLSQFSSNSTPKYIVAIKQLYQYLQTIKNLKIVYYNGLTQYPCFEVYIDVDQVNNNKTRRSAPAYFAILVGCPIF